MIQLVVVLEVGPVDGKLVVRVELAFVGVGGSPWIGADAFDQVHAMIDSWAVVLAPHLRLGWWRVVAWVRSEDDVPVAVEVVKFGCPKVRGVVHAWWRLEEQFGFGIVPVGQHLATLKGDVFVVGVGHVIIIVIAENPTTNSQFGGIQTVEGHLRISAYSVKNGIRVGGSGISRIRCRVADTNSSKSRRQPKLEHP